MADKPPIVRALLQEYGTELRRAEDRHYWVRALAARIEDLPADARVAIADCRFPNELEAIRRWGGWLAKVERPGCAGAGDHASETSLDGFRDYDMVWVNAGTVADLETQIEVWAAANLPQGGNAAAQR